MVQNYKLFPFSPNSYGFFNYQRRKADISHPKDLIRINCGGRVTSLSEPLRRESAFPLRNPQSSSFTSKPAQYPQLYQPDPRCRPKGGSNRVPHRLQAAAHQRAAGEYDLPDEAHKSVHQPHGSQ